MAECDACGKYENLPYQCRRCGNTFCAEHRLPENHDCSGLQNWKDPNGVFDSGFDDSVDDRSGSSSGLFDRGGSSGGAFDRVTSTGGPLGYFRGNATYVFLGLMWVTFAFQFFVFPLLLGIPALSRPWAAVFTLQSDHLAYVWTWITSVFAHGGFTHIAFNSIALYFFGPVVERRLGTKRYVGLFLGAGILAGLAQIATGLLTGGGVAVLGASGAIMGVMGVLTVLNPNLKVYLWFVIPMPLWALTLGFAGFSLFAGFGGLGGGVAHFAHLAGLVVGLAYGQHIKGEVRSPQSLRFGGGGRGGGRGPF